MYVYVQSQVGVLMRNLRQHLINFHIVLRLLHALVSCLPHAPLGKQVLYLLSISNFVSSSVVIY